MSNVIQFPKPKKAPPKEFKLRTSIKWSIVGFAFIPWMLVFFLSFGFKQVPGGLEPWKQSVAFIGTMWVVFSPLFTIFVFGEVLHEVKCQMLESKE